MAEGAEDQALENGSAAIVGNSDHNPEWPARYVDLFEEQRVQGLLIASVGDIMDRTLSWKFVWSSSAVCLQFGVRLRSGAPWR